LNDAIFVSSGEIFAESDVIPNGATLSGTWVIHNLKIK